MSEPTTAADSDTCIDCSNDPTGRGICGTHLALAEARQQDDSALRSVAQAVVLAATKHTPEIVALNRALAALPPSAPPALDVDVLAEAWSNVMDGRRVEGVRLNPSVTTPDDWRSIAAEYARLQERP